MDQPYPTVPGVLRALNRRFGSASLPIVVERLHRWGYVRSDGRVGHGVIGVPSLLLTARGRTSGTPRTSVLIYAADGHDLVLVASNRGGDRDPQWLLNIRAEPAVQVMVGRQRLAGRARVVERGAADYERLWALVNANNERRYEGYQAATTRPIPLVVITPTGQQVAQRPT